ncbi:MAG TPA: hypothetical protein VK752_05205 [Bryobacteraceae bacterium]|nr:hypothetical protein [Bryobacteraceae bacterium]
MPGSTTPPGTAFLSAGSTFATNRTAIVDGLGRIGTVQGAPTNCVLVNGTSAPCGTGGSGGSGGSSGTTVQATFYQSGAPLVAPATLYIVCAFAGTITGWDIDVDQGTATFKVWKTASGTSNPTSGNSISTSGVSISSGTEVHSTTVSDFTTLIVNAGDIIGINLAAVSGATQAQFTLELNSPGSSFSGNETPGQTSTLVYTLAHLPAPGSLELYLNGLLMTPNLDYTLSGQTITFVSSYSELLATAQQMTAYYPFGVQGTGSAGGVWGAITGTLSSQTDLQSALNAKLATGGTAALATALASTPAQCSGGQVATGITAAGTANCTAITALPVYSPGGSAVSGAHVVTGTQAATSYTATIALSGSAVFASGAPFCTATDVTSGSGVQYEIASSSGTSLVFGPIGGAGTDTISFICVGN